MSSSTTYHPASLPQILDEILLNGNRNGIVLFANQISDWNDTASAVGCSGL